MAGIALVGVNAKYTHTNPAIRDLKNYADKPEVVICEYTINMPVEETLDRLKGLGVDAYGFSIYIWNANYIKRLIEGLRGRALLFAGGPEASADVATYTRLVDYVLVGEGEIAFREFARRLLQGEAIADCPSLVYLDGGKMHRTPRAQPVNLDQLPQPYRDLEKLGGRVIYYESSRGCPFGCTYCLSSAQRGVRFASVDKVKRDLEQFVSAGVMKVKFVDRTFNADRKRAREIFEYIIKKGGSTGFHFEIAADLLDEQTVELLSRAQPGQIQLEIGVQSTHEPTLKAVRREQDFGYTAKMVRKIAAGRNVHQHLDLIAGLPLEGMREFRKSFDDVMSLGAEQVQLGFLKVLPGSNMWEDAKKYGIIYDSNPPYEVVQTDFISREELDLLRRIEYLLGRIYNSGLFITSARRFGEHFASYFAFFERLDAWMGKKDIAPQSLGEKEMALMLLRFGECQNIAFARDVVKFDCMARKTRPSLPGELEEEHQWSRDFYAKLPREALKNLPRGKRPWHFSRVGRFKLDILAYREGKKVIPGECAILFDYTDGGRARIII